MNRLTLSICVLFIVIITFTAGFTGCSSQTTPSQTSSQTSNTVSSVSSTSVATLPGGYIREADSQFNYSVEYPASWKHVLMDPGELSGLLAIYCLVKSETFSIDQDGTSIDLEVRIDRCYDHETQVSGYLDQNLAFPALMYYNVLEQKTVQVGSLTADEIVYVTGPLAEYQKNIWVSFANGDWKYVITYSAPSENSFNGSLNAFNRFLDSFKAG